MKRYLVFTYSTYDASGGWNDFRSDFDTLDGAVEFVESSTRDYYDIVDITTGDEFCGTVADLRNYGPPKAIRRV